MLQSQTALTYIAFDGYVRWLGCLLASLIFSSWAADLPALLVSPFKNVLWKIHVILLLLPPFYDAKRLK
jgi:hypothetical protein